MWKLEDINKGNFGDLTLAQAVKAYIKEKNLNFIIARGKCINLRQDKLEQGMLDTYLAEFSACGFSRISCPGPRPSPPFMAADIDPGTGTAQVKFLIDLTEEAESGRASKFYSKILGAFATQFFAAQPLVKELIFPFELEDTVGSGLLLNSREQGMGIVRE
jgi:hypothetical protein